MLKRTTTKTSRAVALKVAKIAFDKKASDVVVLDMRKVTNICDYFVIMSCESEHKTKSIAEVIKEDLAKEKIFAKSMEGQAEASWVVLDYLSVIVHIFCQSQREFYNLEKLWQDAERIKLRFPIETVQKKKRIEKIKSPHG